MNDKNWENRSAEWIKDMSGKRHKEFLKKAAKEVESWPEWKRASFGLLWRERNPEKVKRWLIKIS